MNLVVSLEGRFEQSPDGAIWTSSVFSRPFWDRYLDVFESVSVLARAKPISQVSDDLLRADGDRVEFRSLPHYLGPVDYFKHKHALTSSIKQAVGPRDAVLLRVSSPIGAIVQKTIKKERRPFGVEVVGDPWDTFAPGASSHPARPVFRRWFAHQLKAQCAEADAAAYVTSSALQRRYPPASGARSTSYSSIELYPEHFRLQPWTVTKVDGPFNVIFVGTLEQLYKAPDVLIGAVQLCHERGEDLTLTLVGGGRKEPSLRSLATEFGLADKVRFLGHLPAGNAVRDQLDQADLFVLPSRQEGLPRAMIEAMARGLPCIGSNVGGIPELLPAEDLVPPGDVLALANKIQEVVSDPARMNRMSARNLNEAQNYRADLLRAKRTEFYNHLRKLTEDWLASRSAP